MNDGGRNQPSRSTARTPGADSPFAVAPAEDMLYSLAADGSRKWIDPVLSTGRYWRWRRLLGWSLIAIFLSLPHIQIGGKPAIFQDIANRQFTVMGFTMQPTEPLILMVFGVCVVISVFVVTAVLGRAWCGYACPHPIYLEFVFRPIERWLEGSPSTRRRRDAGPWTLDRAWRKGAKWIIYALIAFVLSATFVSYFVSWEGLWAGAFSAPLDHRGITLALSAVTGLVFFNFAYFRDQMCTMACPYGRLQNALYDADTLIVGYDTKRGEPRARRSKNADNAGLGDCVDCQLCVRVCPTGMDIRRGLQMECIGCAQCIEVCDDIMAKVDKPAGLIRYTSLRELDTGEHRFLRPRVFFYGAVVLAAYGVLGGLMLARGHADADLLRGGREPFRTLPTGQIANILRVRLTNKLPEAQSFTVALSQPQQGELVVSQSPFTVGPDGVGTLDLVVKIPPSAFTRGKVPGSFVIESDAGAHIEKDFVLLGPYQ